MGTLVHVQLYTFSYRKPVPIREIKHVYVYNMFNDKIA